MMSKILTFLLALTSFLFAQSDFKVLSSNQNSIIIEYTPQFIDTSVRVIENQKYRNTELAFGFVNESVKVGTPAVPERQLNIGVPNETGNVIRVLGTAYKEIDGKITPRQSIEKDKLLETITYNVSPEYNNYVDFPELVSFSDYGISRGLGIQTIRIFPVKFDVNTNTIKLYSKIVFQIDYGFNQSAGKKTEDELLRYSVMNYNTARYWIKSNKNQLAKFGSSVLANGQWVKFEAPEEGIYKIDKATLETFGFDLSSVDPRTIKIYNNGGKKLSEKVNDPRPVDLVENAIMVIGENDGHFDDGDYILFYGRGTQFRDYDPATKTIKRFNNPFTNKNYYFITVGGNNGKRIQNEVSLNTTPQIVQTSTVAFADYEVDKINLAKSGREFFGDDFSQSVPGRTYLNKLDGRISSIPINYKFRFVNASPNSFSLTVTENSTTIFSQILGGYGGADYTFGVDYTKSAVYNGDLTDNRSSLNFSISTGSVNNIGYIDYFEITYEKQLKQFENKILFFSKDTSAIVEYYLNGFLSTDINAFDVSDPSNVKKITPENGWPSGGDYKFQVMENGDTLKKYIAIGNGSYLTPVNPTSVENQNLRGIADGAKYIIIYHKNFEEAANRLKAYRESEARIPISTITVDVDEIYNEFSCGSTDISGIRDFIKYAYDNWQNKPEYFLLLGKGTYDYKNVEGFGDNFIPTWETEESLILILEGGDSYCTDDFYARVDGNDLRPDLSFGRLTVSSADEANAYVDKVVHYEKGSEQGNWRNLITLIADDGWTSTRYEGSEHTAPSEALANDYIPQSFDLKKIYAADYPVVITGNGRRKPTVNTDIINAMNQGTLLVNYIGHGNPDVWAHEYIFERSVAIPQLISDKYFFLCAATCDFGVFDIPNFTSTAEDLVFDRNGGAIASFSAARVVFSGSNHYLNIQLINNLFNQERDSLNLPIPVGLAVFMTKSNLYSVNDQKFHLLGDPLLRLNEPEYDGTIDSINGQLVNNNIQIKALSKTKISGTISKPDSTKWNDFNGEGLLTVFDSERTKHLEEINYDVKIPGGVIFRGRVSVNNGEFNADFVVPKDISYENKNGKIIFYFFNMESDGIAYTNKIIVGGTDSTAKNDGEGPEIEIFFDDASYTNAYLVSPEPDLIVKLSDETGLNTTGTGVGHKLEGILNGDQGNPLDFTNYFSGELDAGGKRGEINYKFNRLDNGDYNLNVKAWDVFNNFSSEESFFTVVSSDALVVRDVYNYPNPFSANTTFTFQQNLAQPIDVKINIYTIAGRLIKVLEEKNINQKFVKINWDGRDDEGDRLANGTYLYKLIVKTSNGDYSESLIGKMAVIK